MSEMGEGISPGVPQYHNQASDLVSSKLLFVHKEDSTLLNKLTYEAGGAFQQHGDDDSYSVGCIFSLLEVCPLVSSDLNSTFQISIK